jgi:hypothetical protein
MSSAQKLNAMTRAIAYTSLALWLATSVTRYLWIGLLVIAVMSLAHSRGYGPEKFTDDDTSYVDKSRRGNTNAKASNSSCVMPTPDNPFGNYLNGHDPNRPSACPYETVKKQANESFRQSGPARSMYDIYDTMHGDRQFYQLPGTQAVSDMDAFKKYAYGGNLQRSVHI